MENVNIYKLLNLAASKCVKSSYFIAFLALFGTTKNILKIIKKVVDKGPNVMLK